MRYDSASGSLRYELFSSVLVAEGLTMAGTIDYGALASALGGVLTLAIMIWIAYAGRS